MHKIHCFKAQEKYNFLYCEKSYLFMYLGPVNAPTRLAALSPQD